MEGKHSCLDRKLDAFDGLYITVRPVNKTHLYSICCV